MDDFVIGAPDHYTSLEIGSAYIVFGRAEGFTTKTVDLSTIVDGTHGFVFHGIDPFSHTGQWLS
ncbi:MAG: hypothetical protein MUP98_00765, partial [Candidatus Aminicenantes bacterium]|nr:hypothetical protein [Candidatus Aminicenantes bacterium]